MTWEEYKLKILEKELSEKEGQLIKILSIKGNYITICTYGTYLLMEKEGFIRRN
jgi:hypothetical protein